MGLLEKRPFKIRLRTFVRATGFSIGVVSVMFWEMIKQGPRKFFQIKKRETRPKVLDDPLYGKHEFAQLTTVKLHYVVNGPPDKPLLLFLHGFPQFWYCWRHQIKEFSKDYRTVAVDMRGYGESDIPRSLADVSFDKAVSDIVELIEYFGCKKCILVGHDMGGVFAWAVVQKYPQLIEKHVACNSPPLNSLEKVLFRSEEQRKRAWYMTFFTMPFLPEFALRVNDFKFLIDLFVKPPMGAKPGSFTEADIEAMKYNFQMLGDFSGSINYYRCYRKFYLPFVFPEEKSPVPTLIIWGTNDARLVDDVALESAKLVDNCTIKYIKGASHWVQEEEPQLVNKYIREFLEQKS